MKVLRPIQSNFKVQSFGDNLACVYPNNRVVGKVGGICPEGSVDLYRKLGMLGHNGEDWMLWRGEPIYFPVEFYKESTGEVASANSVTSVILDRVPVKWWAKTEVDLAGGIGIDVISAEPVRIGDYEGCIKFRFWHLQKVNVHDDQEIKTGDLIGFGNSTGLSGGDHLHWSLKKCDKDGNALNKNNGYFGAEDFSPYFQNEFVLDYLKRMSEVKMVEIEFPEYKLTTIQILNKVIFIIVHNLRKALGMEKGR